MYKFSSFLAVIIVFTAGCSSSLLSDQDISPTNTIKIDETGLVITIAAEESQTAQASQEVWIFNLSETAVANMTATRYAAPLNNFVTIGPTLTPSLTPRATSPPSSGGGNSTNFGTCKDTTGGRTKVRMQNNTGGVANLTFVGPETRSCAIQPGLYIFYMKSGVYSISGTACGQTHYLGSHVINAVWKYTLSC